MNNDCFEELEENVTSNSGLEKELYSSTLNGTEKNINFFLKLSNIFKIICFVLAGIIMFFGLVAFLCGAFEVFLICLIPSIAMVITALLSTPFLEWKAYTLKNIYEINKSMNKEK